MSTGYGKKSTQNTYFQQIVEEMWKIQCMQHDWAVDLSGALIVDYKTWCSVSSWHFTGRQGGRETTFLTPSYILKPKLVQGRS
jgi:hypothetical protein